MGNAFSKLAGLRVGHSVDHNCYEGIHTWDPSCGRVFVQVFLQCMKSGSLIYLPFYLIPQLIAIKWTGRRNLMTVNQNNNSNEGEEDQSDLVSSGMKGSATTKEGEEGGRKCDASPEQGKDVAEDSVRVDASPDLMKQIADRLKFVVKQTAISSSVFAVNTALIIGLTCIQNHMTGKVFYLSPFVSSLFSHSFSFKYERASRRNSLTMFTIKTCFEILYNMLQESAAGGMIQDPGRGGSSVAASRNEKTAAVFLFASSLALNFYFLNRNSTRDPLMSILSFIVGPERGRNASSPPGEGTGETRSVLHKVRGGRGGGEERNVRETNSSQDQEYREEGEEDGEESMPAVRGSGSSCGDDECVRYCRCCCSSSGDSSQNCSPNVIHKEFRAGNQGMEQEDYISQGVSYQEKKCCNHRHDAGHSSGRPVPRSSSPSPSSPSSSSPSFPPCVPSSPLSSCTPPSCRHALLTVTSCPSYALTGSVQMFMIGWTIQVSLNLLKKRKRAFSSGRALLQEVLIHEDSLKFALFLSNLILIYRSSSCALRRLTNRIDESVNMMISGFLSGFSLCFFPSTQIALHTFWKTMFTMYFMRFGNTSRSQAALDALFVVMDSFLINCMVMESRFVPRSYLRLIDSFTGSCLTKFNIVTNYMLGGRDNAFRYGNRFPELNADYVSKRYMETIGCWSLERHDA